MKTQLELINLAAEHVVMAVLLSTDLDGNHVDYSVSMEKAIMDYHL